MAGFVAFFLPLASIVAALASLNLEHAVFELMAGLRPTQHTSSDSAYALVIFLTWMSMLASPMLALLYILAVVRAWRKPVLESHASDVPPEH